MSLDFRFHARARACWEIESIRPRTLFKIVKEGLKANVPEEFLEAAEARERAARLARPVTERLRKAVEKEALAILEKGVPEREVVSRIIEKVPQMFEKFLARIRRRKK